MNNSSYIGYVIINKGYSMKRNNKHPYGYQPKINFWSDRYDQAKSDNDLSTMEYCLDKLTYFIKRQREVYA